MRFGLSIFATDYTLQPSELGRLAEERGFETVLLPEHTHIPVSRETPWPGGEGLPREYMHSYDPFVALSMMAEATERLRVGTGICLVTQRDPVITAKEVASLDRLSGGRFVFGVGAGWNVEEMRTHGTDAAGRFGLMRERIEAMKEIWAHEEAEYRGERVSFERMWSWPKPVQEPHPPIFVGGGGERVLDRVVAFGDGWLPNRLGDVEQMAARVRLLREKAEAAGREAPAVWGFNAPADRDHLLRLYEVGVEKVLFPLPSDEPDTVRRILDERAELAENIQEAALGT